MATPTTNFVPAITFGVGPGLGLGWQLIAGSKWGGAVGTGVTLTYSFPKPPTGWWLQVYGDNEPNSWSAFNIAEINATKAALVEWTKTANVKFTQNVDTQFSVGELRFAYSGEVSDDASAHAYYPSGSPEAGDAWFNPDNFNFDGGGIPKGSFDFYTLLHEIGHTLGLEHPFDGPTRLPNSLDNFFHTVMSYTASPFSGFQDNFASFYPTTPMYYDLLAIQSIYGKNTTVNAGNSTYLFKDGQRYFQTINDAGGNDLMIYNGVEDSSINLNPKAFSKVSETIFFNGGSSRATVAIGPGVFIERATGGSGDDLLVGNGVANVLNGRIGDDVLRGNGGSDIHIGGPGNDRHLGGGGSDIFLFNTIPNSATSVDKLLDYALFDAIRLTKNVFKKLNPGVLSANFFEPHAPDDANDYVYYIPSSGKLFYDTNGNAPGQWVNFAILPKGLAMTNTEFFVI